ncbi:hypothetical protein GGI11_003403 [Coemansia sp. RSA 2049]|nr:hypothetical protein LPJ72_000629 [Coemansia sp. Benny D160-2]KAJ2510040.1 hypothetical protein H4217_008058 [Coemansia sp. RSA 1939]KAJ2516599.1 hypothetical protein GGI11_003403 [Coemansia sp. RSA 2049]KAJ2592197.1 hypothetical protein EV177_008767 [Coemansia sp. RSA 1804]KAJ2656861.1 hypothetical protein GGH99_007098 [Coemansia sp. RSA 1285]
MPRQKTATSASTTSKSKVKKSATAGTGKAKKKISGYNKYMKAELARVKAGSPGISHKDAFKKAAENWSTSPDNPKSGVKA